MNFVDPDAFHNPYHFVPALEGNGPQGITRNDFQANAPSASHLTHDRWVKGLLSGRILCRLITVSPLVIGGQQNKSSADTPNRYNQIYPFIIGGKPAIPASSLRGMIAALSEAASNSALRVLGFQAKPADEKILGKKPWLNYSPFPGPFFEAINKELLPLGSGATRDQISIAEQLFGFVSASTEKTDPSHGMAFAGRVAFNLGVLHEGQVSPWLDEDTTIYRVAQELASPKPPSVAFYFKPVEGTGRNAIDPRRAGPNPTVSNDDCSPRTDRPQGRKYYLPHSPKVNDNNRWSWETHPHLESPKNPDNHRKSKVRPVKPGVTFFFHIDFSNLTETELGLLCYALQPTPVFHHRIGMGKSLGLGLVQIVPEALWYVDRFARYSRGGWERNEFYHQLWLPSKSIGAVGSNPQCSRNDWPGRYHAHLASPDVLPRINDNQKHAWPTLSAGFRRQMEKSFPQIIKAIEVLGNPAHLEAPVHYPQCRDRNPGTRDFELEYYRWWQTNTNKKVPQFLVPIGHDPKSKTPIPTLRRNDPPRPRGQQKGRR